MMGFSLNDVFSNREIATIIWTSVVIAIVLWNKDMRSSFRGVLSALFAPKLFLLFGLYAVWVSMVVSVLATANLWTVAGLKATVLWYVFSGAALLGRSIQHKSGDPFFRNILVDNFKIIIAVEFIVVTYSFSLFSELLFVPFMAILGVLLAVSETDKKFSQVQKLFEFVTLGIVIFLIWHFIQNTIENRGAIFSIATLREVLLPIFLSVLSIPVFYLAYCYSSWELTLIRIDQKAYQSDQLKAQAKSKFFWALFLQPWLLSRAVRQFQMLPAEKPGDLDQVIEEARKYELLKKKPPYIDKKSGWSPFKAESFLKTDQLLTNDYHRSGFDDEWFAESVSKYLDNAGIFETIIYRVKGGAEIATTLQLKGNFRITPSPEHGLQQFWEVADTLTNRATKLEHIPEELQSAKIANQDNSLSIESHIFSIKFNEYTDANMLDVEFTISVI